MAILLALSCALVYGLADYCGGRATRVHPAAIVTVVGQMVSLVLVVTAVVLIGTPVAGLHDWLWSAAGGAAGAVGLLAFYFALGHGVMSVVAPTTAVWGAVLPVGIGLLEGERPHPVALIGIVLAIGCIALVSGAGGHAEHRSHTSRRVFAAAVFAGLGFGALFVAFAHTSSASGLWPLVAARLISVPLLAAVALGTRVRMAADRRPLRLAVLAGMLDMGANVLYLAAVRGGLLSVVAVISSLYPASTVTLAFVVDGERVSRLQAVGLLLAGVALALVAVGRH
ncbi:MAG: EamA family transporter [Ilumatobacteraceae bacterium]